jgi:hypothetical protein
MLSARLSVCVCEVAVMAVSMSVFFFFFLSTLFFQPWLLAFFVFSTTVFFCYYDYSLRNVR